MAGEEEQRASTSSSTSTSTAAEQPKRTSERVESLGWLTESSVMPKKHKAIEGVGAASLVQLKAQLYRTQEQALKDKAQHSSDSEFLRAKKKFLAPDVLSAKNAGVDSRAHKDKLELKATNDGSKSYAALEKKAELYEKLARGELPDEEDKEKYCVDFFSKSLTHEKHDEPEIQDSRDTQANVNGEADEDLVPSSKLVGPGRTSETMNSDEHKRFVWEVHEEANQAREKATTAKLRRQEQEASRREKLRQAYLRKQLEKLTSAKASTNQ